jgi:flagellar biosynthetic protein FliR
MQPLVLNASDVAGWVGRLWWPCLRVSGFILAAPIASEVTVPARVKIVLTVALGFLLAPLAPVPDALSIFSGAGVLAAAREVLIGVAIGMVVQLAFDGLQFAGQTVSMSMGLGFATLVDPQRGASVPVLGQLYSIVGMLSYLAVNGHLTLLAALANSYHTMPIAAAGVDEGFLSTVANWGARIFETGLVVALPAVVALVIVNFALGVVSRAAPQLNLFGIGFTITLASGLFVLMVGLDGTMTAVGGLIDRALQSAADLVAAPRGSAH